MKKVFRGVMRVLKWVLRSAEDNEKGLKRKGGL
jgi:hypothetical protein